MCACRGMHMLHQWGCAFKKNSESHSPFLHFVHHTKQLLVTYIPITNIPDRKDPHPLFFLHVYFPQSCLPLVLHMFSNGTLWIYCCCSQSGACSVEIYLPMCHHIDRALHHKSHSSWHTLICVCHSSLLRLMRNNLLSRSD